MALLSGTTRLVNSIVIAGLMRVIVAANFLTQSAPQIQAKIGYIGILCTNAMGYLTPLERLPFQSF
jgi:hypothetical protein